jgi:[ribosomal protein S18]-alanine N-acetyltransferase
MHDDPPPLNVRFRAYAAEDRAAVIAMLVGSEPWVSLGYGSSDWERTFSPFPDGREGHVLEVEAEAAAFALLRPRFLLGDYLELFAVAPAFRARGLGGALLGHLEGLVFGRSRNLWVCVSDFNDGARRFYMRHGFQEVGPVHDLLVAGHAEILLRKTTGPARQRSGA